MPNLYIFLVIFPFFIFSNYPILTTDHMIFIAHFIPILQEWMGERTVAFSQILFTVNI